ncbi:MAG: nucleotidyltransferase domain-containing protein [Clostridiaceae bacterium]|nr:nucleotidyltransferase domain-containing protein [Provencibacterium sp.]MCI8881107.1 nucleotidyltransferase domain-containing protein [Clostridiaceae bacterium]
MCTKSELITVLNQVRTASEKLYGNRLEKIILYGSYARGDNTQESDIDIMLLLNGNVFEIKKFRSQTAEMASDISLEREVF